jgi:hypothetical protein
MQVSALNLIIAAQQARGATPAQPAPQTAPQAKVPEAGKPAFSPASSDFTPLSFGSQAAPPQPAASSTAPAGYPANAPVGSQIDIRV